METENLTTWVELDLVFCKPYIEDALVRLTLGLFPLGNGLSIAYGPRTHSYIMVVRSDCLLASPTSLLMLSLTTPTCSMDIDSSIVRS